MKYELERLEACVNKWASENPGTISDKEITEFQQHAWATQKSIIHNLLLQKNQTLLNTYFSVHMQKLVDLSDRLFYVVKQNMYHPLITSILDLLGTLKKAAPTLIDRNLALPKAFRLIHSERLLSEWQQITTKLTDAGANADLIQFAKLPFVEFASLKLKLSWFHYIWLKQYLYELGNMDFKEYEPYPSSAYLVYELLIKMDFNNPRLVSYCNRVIKKNADRFESLKEQLLVLNMSKKIIRQFVMLSAEPFYPKKPTAVEGICNWIDQEADFMNKYDLSLFAAVGQKVSMNPYKFIYDMNIEQLAFWKKLQYDHRVYVEKDLDSFSIKIAYNSSTKNKSELSVGSITSKMYTKDSRVISPVYEMITAMMATIQPILELLQKMSDDLRPFMS